MPFHWLYIALEQELPSASSLEPRNLFLTRGNGQQSFWPTELVTLTNFINSPAFHYALLQSMCLMKAMCAVRKALMPFIWNPNRTFQLVFLFWWSSCAEALSVGKLRFGFLLLFSDQYVALLGYFWWSHSPSFVLNNSWPLPGSRPRRWLSTFKFMFERNQIWSK